MIHVINFKNLSKYGEIFQNQFKLRHNGFIERQKYDVKVFDGLEYDQYDTPATTYFIYSSDGKNVEGVSRLIPTQQGCMLKDYWPDLVQDKSLLSSDDVWESTRFCIDNKLSPDYRRNICNQLACAHIEFGLAYNIRMIIGLMPTLILRSVFEKSGVRLDRLGEVFQIGDHSKVQAAGIPIDYTQIDSVLKKTGLFNVTGLNNIKVAA